MCVQASTPSRKGVHTTNQHREWRGGAGGGESCSMVEARHMDGQRHPGDSPRRILLPVTTQLLSPSFEYMEQ